MKLVKVEFHSNTLEVEPQSQRIVVKDICQNIGLNDYQGQQRKLKSDPTYQSKLIKVKTKGGMQDVFTIPLSKLNGWLFSINPNRVKPEVRERLIEYKNECFDVLYRHFNNQATATPTQLDMITPYEVRRDLATTRRLLTIEKRKHRETAEYYEKKLKALTAKEPFTVTEVPNTQHTDIEDLKKNFKIILQEHFELENANAKLRRDNTNLQRALINFKDRYHSVVLEADNKVEAIRGELEKMTNAFQQLPNLANDGKNLNTDTLSKHQYW